MKVSVKIERDPLGRLHAYVTQQRGDGYVEKGDDLLKRHVIRNIEAARIEIGRQIREIFKRPLVELERIDYTLPEDWKP